MPAISVVSVIAAAAFVMALAMPFHRYRRLAAGLVIAGLGAASLQVGLGTDRVDALVQLARTAAERDRWFLRMGVGLMLAGGAAALALALLPARSGAPVTPSMPLTLQRGGWEWIVPLLGVAALLSPHLPVALGLVFLAGALELLLPRRPRLLRCWLGAALVFLGAAAVLTATIIGPLPATYVALREGPIGDPAARLLVLLLALPVLVYLAWWSLIPAGGLLLGRIAGSVLPAGVLLWQGIGMPLTLLVAGWCAVRRRPLLLGASLGGFGLWSGNPQGWMGGGLLLAATMLWPLLPATGQRVGPFLQRGIAGIAGAGLVLTIAGGLQVQVGYTVLLAVISAGRLVLHRGVRAAVASL